jgi:very-short-patch-repair endonuclease
MFYESSESWLGPAYRQCGLLTSAQLAASGVSDFSRRQLVERGVLRRRARGVWAAAGWPDEWPQAVWAALLEAGSAAVVFRRTAAAVWGVDGVPVPQPIELALPPGHQSRVKAVYRVPTLQPLDVTVRDTLPITTVARTLADLGSVESLGVVERAVEWALRNGVVTIAELQSLTERLRTKGGRTLKTMLVQRPVAAPATESDAETLFVQLVRAAGFPDPVRQYWIVLRGRRYRLDFAWPALRLAVEIDGAAVHGPDELPRDLRRQNQIILDGWLILRFPWTMLRRGTRDVESDLWAAWGLRGGLVRPR